MDCIYSLLESLLLAPIPRRAIGFWSSKALKGILWHRYKKKQKTKSRRYEQMSRNDVH